jgi:hypothetical protein
MRWVSRRLEGLGSVFSKGCGEEEAIEMGLLRLPVLATGEDDNIQIGSLELFNMMRDTMCA